MPTGYVKKLAKKHHTSVGHSEAEWEKAKSRAAKQGKEKNFAYVTSIYKNMMGESVKDLSLIEFLRLSEMDDLEGASDIAYGGEKDEFNDEDFDNEDFGDEDFDNEDFGDEDFGDEGDIESADDMAYGSPDDEDFDDLEGEQGHELADVIPPDELDDEGEFGDEHDSEEFPVDDRLRQESFGMLKNLMMITEKKKGKSLKKAAKSVYHRDYVKTKNRPYRKYDPKAREHQQASESIDYSLSEKWAQEYTVPESKKGMFKGRSKAELESELARLKASGPHKEGSAEYTKMKELNFAIRAKSGWK